METRQNNFLDMVLSVKTVMDGNRAFWASKKPVRESYDFTASSAAKLEALRIVQRTGRSGVVLNKTDIGHLMIETAVEVAGQICAYATQAGDRELLAFADVEANHFHELPDTEMDDRALSIHDGAKTLHDAHTTTPPAVGQPNFTDYDVTPEKLLALANLAGEYAAGEQPARGDGEDQHGDGGDRPDHRGVARAFRPGGGQVDEALQEERAGLFPGL